MARFSRRLEASTAAPQSKTGHLVGGPLALSDPLRTGQQIERMVALRKLRIATIAIPKVMEFIADLLNMMNQPPRSVKSEGAESASLRVGHAERAGSRDLVDGHASRRVEPQPSAPRRVAPRLRA